MYLWGFKFEPKFVFALCEFPVFETGDVVCDCGGKGDGEVANESVETDFHAEV